MCSRWPASAELSGVNVPWYEATASEFKTFDLIALQVDHFARILHVDGWRGAGETTTSP
jgi:hypothetical protein